MSYYFKCLPSEDTSASFWQNKRTLQRKSEKCCFSKHFTVNSEMVCARSLQRNMKMSTVFFSQRQGQCIFPYKNKG